MWAQDKCKIILRFFFIPYLCIIHVNFTNFTAEISVFF